MPAARSWQINSKLETFDARPEFRWSIGAAGAACTTAAATPAAIAEPALSPAAAEPEAGSADEL